MSGINNKNLKIILVSKNENAISIQYIMEIFRNYNIFLVSPNAKKSIYKNLTLINDNEILNFNKIYEFMKENGLNRIGWYYQQFLKYEIVMKLDGEYFFVIDGDSIVRKELLSNKLFFTNRVVPEGYYRLYKEIFSSHLLSNKSFVTNQMIFNKKYLQMLIKEIESFGNKEEWFYIILKKIKENKSFMFSEYQFYAEYVLNNNLIQDTKNIKVFRRFDLINDTIKNALKKYSVIAYENHHKINFFDYIKYNIYYKLGINLG